MNNVCIIPARGGSSRIYHKNIRLFHGKPIIAYSILTAIESGLFEQVIVSTDDPEIATIAEIYGATVMMRDAEYAENSIGTQEVARYVLDDLAGCGQTFDFACVIYATAPMLTADDLKNAFDVLEGQQAGFVFSVGDLPLSDAGQFYFGVSEMFGNYPLISEVSCLFPIPKERVCDINIESDWLRAEDMYAALVRSQS